MGFKYIYILLIIILPIVYFFPQYLHMERIVNLIDLYFGNSKFFLVFFAILYGNVLFFNSNNTNSKNKKIAKEIKLILLFFGIVGTLLLVFLYFFNIDFSTIGVEEELKEQIITSALYSLNLGLVPTYIIYLFISIPKNLFQYVYISIFSFSVLALIFLIISLIKNLLFTKKHNHNLTSEEKKRKKLIKDQITLKEAEDRKILEEKISKKKKRDALIEKRIREFHMENSHNSDNYSDED